MRGSAAKTTHPGADVRYLAGIPAVAAIAPGPAVTATTATGVVLITAAARVAWRAPHQITIDIAISTCAGSADASAQRISVVHAAWRSDQSLALGASPRARNQTAVFEAADRVRCSGALRVHIHTTRTPKTTPVAIDSLPIQVDVASGFKHQNAAPGTVPR